MSVALGNKSNPLYDPVPLALEVEYHSSLVEVQKTLSLQIGSLLT
jgi:hypothetical protein